MPEPQPRRRAPQGVHRTAIDATIAAALGLFCVSSFLGAERTVDQPRAADALGVVLVLAATLPLAARRRAPAIVFAVVTGATLGVYLLDYPDSGLPMAVLLALYTVAERSDRRITVGATAILLVMVATVVADASGMDGGTLVGTLSVFVLAAVWGDRTKVREAYAEALEQRAAEKERARIQAAEQAVAQERLRIARELHDVVAHAMSVVAVQSGVGAHVIDSRPDEAKRILETISRTSRDGLEEMRRLLGVLRSDPAQGGDLGDLAPVPGLGRLEDLAEGVRAAGLPVSVDVEGDLSRLPAGVDLAAYRIVQEALTNVVKHAGSAEAEVRVRSEPGTVAVEVLDDGRGPSERTTAHPGSGQGLVGMRERAGLYGGTLEAGPRPGGGYRVATTLRYAAP